MKTEILPQLERLLRAGKKEEARAILRAALAAPLSDEERGAILVGFAAAYLALTNSINEVRREELAEEVLALEEVNALEREVDDKLRLVKIRRELG